MKKKNVIQWVALFLVSYVIFFILFSLMMLMYGLGVELWVRAAMFFGHSSWGLLKVVSLSSFCIAFGLSLYKITKRGE